MTQIPTYLIAISGGEPDQLFRKREFERRYPEVFLGLTASGTWQACIPEDNGETIITRWKLRDLLDELSKKYPHAASPGCAAL